MTDAPPSPAGGGTSAPQSQRLGGTGFTYVADVKALHDDFRDLVARCGFLRPAPPS